MTHGLKYKKNNTALNFDSYVPIMGIHFWLKFENISTCNPIWFHAWNKVNIQISGSPLMWLSFKFFFLIYHFLYIFVELKKA